jgi:uncharacterized protein with NRDE domain
MCLILLALRAHPDTDLLLAGNRDEFYARPSAPPALIASSPRIFAGRDLEAGGTWMGRNEHGLVAALTNRRQQPPREPPDAKSRGEIVRTLLGFASPEQAAAWLAVEPVARYRPFNVLFGTPARCYFFSSQEMAPPRLLEPGCYALSNSTLDDVSWPKVARSHAFFARSRALPGEALLVALQAFLCDPTPPDRLPSADRSEEIHGPLGAVFIRTPGYGTVSASIICEGGALGDRYYFAEAADMDAAQPGWARRAFGNGEQDVPPDPAGSPFRLLSFPG